MKFLGSLFLRTKTALQSKLIISVFNAGVNVKAYLFLCFLQSGNLRKYTT